MTDINDIPTMSPLQQLNTVINTYTQRLSWDQYFMSIAILISSRSPSPRLKVGSVIVKDNRLVSAGYNGFLSGAPHVSIVVNNHEQNTIHSEQNAICDAAKRGVSISGATLYVSHYPCLQCTKCIIAAGIKNIKYYNDYNNDPLVKDLFEMANIEISKLSDT